MIMKTDVGTEIELDLKPENIENTDNEQRIEFIVNDDKER